MTRQAIRTSRSVVTFKSTLSHDYDLVTLKQRVLDLFQWYDQDDIRNQYLAPYFPLVQSSGLGKTKLLYELKQDIAMKEPTYHAVLVLCSSGELEGDMLLTYSQAVELEEGMKREPDPQLKYREVEKDLEHACRHCAGKPTILLFDEAQNLLVGKDHHLFNCITWWLAKKNKKPQKVVAVFAGSTLQFAHIAREPPDCKQWGDYWMNGADRYPPFFKLHTMGCLLPSSSRRRTGDATCTEFDESIPYGRPLFCKMGEQRLLGEDSQIDILTKLLLSHVDHWWDRVDSCFSVLATRIQMGQTSFNIASELVSRGYAVLQDLDMDQRLAVICHLPDPVPARLAMCLMKEDWKMEECSVTGRPRHFWVSKMAEIFSEQTCEPSAGGVGEVFCALYLLLCGDILRFQNPNNPECKHFSVRLCQWIHLLIDGGSEQDLDSVTETIDASICFIQITQNYLRFEESMHAWTQQHFLEHLYKSRSAFYVFEDCSVFDIFGSIRCNGNGSPEYLPLLVSVVNLPKLSPSEATSACCAMEMMLTKARCYGGLCLLLVLGRTIHTEFDEDLLLTIEDLENIPTEIVAKVVEIPNDDSFDITRQFWGATSTGTEVSEIFGSHSFLGWHKPEDIESSEFLRTGKRTTSADGDEEPLHYLCELREALRFTPLGADK
jgi:hypothetical protein